MDSSPWHIHADAITAMSPHPIARSSSSEVFTASYYGSEVAVKQLRDISDLLPPDMFRRQLNTWYNLSHPHVLPLLGACDIANQPLIVTPLMPNGTLSTYIRNAGSTCPLEEKLRLLCQVASGMVYLHAKGLSHNDLKPQNVFLNSSRDAVVAGFCSLVAQHNLVESSTSDSEPEINPSIQGTLDYMAPEMLDDDLPAVSPKKANVYAFGIMLYEVLNDCKAVWVTATGDPMRVRTIEAQICRGSRPKTPAGTPDGVPEDIRPLVEQCWHQDPNKRPEFSAILAALEPLRAALSSQAPKSSQALRPPGTTISTLLPSPDWLGELEALLPLVPNTFRVTRSQAMRGDPEACVQIAMIVSANMGAADPLWPQVARLLQTGADHNSLEAQFHLGWLHWAGIGVDQSDAIAFRCWSRVRNDSDDPALKPIATFMVGWCYYLGRGTDQDKPEGIDLIHASATDEFDLGGLCFEPNQEPASSDTFAAQEFSKLCQFASNQDWLCKHLSALCYVGGYGVGKDETRASQIFTNLGNQGHDVSQHWSGLCIYNGWGIGRNDTRAVQWFVKAAEQGDSYAMNRIALCYKYGHGVTLHPARAIEWFTKSAMQGNHWGQFNLGKGYYTGSGINQDFCVAAEWYAKSAEQGNPKAQSALGRCYYTGKGVARDYNKAAEWLAKSAMQGYCDGQFGFASCYEHGFGVTQDFEQAAHWYRLAEAQGSTDATNILSALRNQGIID
ncbi:kinase-like domain-containing protein [Polychytrium aggregatum]|uniref:kinase-like domain-containing protein n=1 Tax=Polychytrium aggregatum TaxID=110093 RepID=UPI0022FE6764|nr:kinase-like domain-containing protein [Polychytrium aggregatum]KAI9199342.1 kinase-like domain-containing protein [Polychytrium aggregatum]